MKKSTKRITFLSMEYLLDNGDGLELHADGAHDMMWADVEETSNSDGTSTKIVASRGMNEYGTYISVGLWKGEHLVLARRYVEDDDARARMSAQRVLKEVITRKSVSTTMPWIDRVCCCGSYEPREEKEMKGKRKRTLLLDEVGATAAACDDDDDDEKDA